MTPKPLKTSDMAAPGSAAHSKMITASKLPAILGLSPVLTREDVWMEMSGHATPRSISGDHLDWGHDVEDALANWWLRKNPGWQANAGEVAYTDTDLPFPNQVTLDRRARRGRARHRLEFKSTVKVDDWTDEDGNVVVPPYVTAQDLAQGGVSGIHDGDVVVLIADRNHRCPHILPSVWNNEGAADMWEGVKDLLAQFHESLTADEPPVPPADLVQAVIDSQPTPPEEKTSIDITGDPVLERYRKAAAALDDAQAALDDATADLEEIAHGHRQVKADGKTVMSWQTGRFSASRLPDEAKHLIHDTRFQKEAFDQKKFRETYPELFKAASGGGSYRINRKNITE